MNILVLPRDLIGLETSAAALAVQTA